MSFYRVTTPHHTFKLPLDTSECEVIRVTYKQGCKKLLKTYEDGVASPGMTLDEEYVVISLTQEETKQFEKGAVDVQLRALDNSGKAHASDHYKVGVGEVNDEEIMR